MKKAIVNKNTDVVHNVIEVDNPKEWLVSAVKRIIQPAREEVRWVNKKTGKEIIKPAQDEKSLVMFRLLGHDFRPLFGPVLISPVDDGELSPELSEDTDYWIKVVDEDHFVLMDDPSKHMSEFIKMSETGAVKVSEKPFDPGSEFELIDNHDGKANKGGKFDRAKKAFTGRPMDRESKKTAADLTEDQIRGNPAMLAMWRAATGNDDLTEDEAVALARSKLEG